MMKYKKCSNCGHENPMENAHCSKCGTVFKNMIPHLKNTNNTNGSNSANRNSNADWNDSVNGNCNSDWNSGANGNAYNSYDNKSNNRRLYMYIAVGCAVVLLCALALLAGMKHRHVWLDATCTAPQTCEECGETKGVAMGHQWRDATNSAPRSCVLCGATEGEPLSGEDPTIETETPTESIREMETEPEKDMQSSREPSEDDLIPFGPVIDYPKASSYLPAYETMYVKAPKGYSIYVFWNPDDASSRRKFYLYEGDEVVVLARQGSVSCVIFTDQSGEQQVGWVTSDYLVYEYRN